MDVKIAFLNGELDEEIYMEQQVGFVIQGQEHKVCKLLSRFMASSSLRGSGTFSFIM